MANAAPGFTHAPDTTDGRRVAIVGAVLVALVVLCAIAAAGITRGLAHHYARPPATSTALPATEGPPLEPDPTATLARFRTEKRALLEGYAWVDRAQGIARIPIDEAMRIVAAQAGAASRTAVSAEQAGRIAPPQPAGAKP
jgi:hypothetical protein